MPDCDYVTSRLHDYRRHHDAKHPSTDSVKEMIDCPYGGCGHTGVHGFKRMDHLQDHCKRYHRRDLPVSMGGTGKKIEEGGQHDKNKGSSASRN